VAGTQNAAAAQSAGSHQYLTRSSMNDLLSRSSSGHAAVHRMFASTHQTLRAVAEAR
jgi:hypothetical protein